MASEGRATKASHRTSQLTSHYRSIVAYYVDVDGKRHYTERPPEGFNPRTHPLSQDIGRTTPRSYHTALLVSHFLVPASGVDLSLDNDEVTQEHIFSGIDLTLANALCEGLSASRAVRELPAALPPSLKSGRQGACEAAQREKSFVAASNADDDVSDVLIPDDPFDMSDPTDVFAVFDESGHHVQWPWEKVHPSSAKRRRYIHRLDASIQKAMLASTADGRMGANSTGVRKWRKFCKAENINPHRPLDPSSPLLSKLREEWLCMRFVISQVEDDGVATSTAASYFGQVQGWHAKEFGIKLAAGMKLCRLPAMLKGLRRIHGDAGRKVRRGFSPQMLRTAMDACLDPNNREHANIRAALSLAFQGLLRGAECSSEGKFKINKDMSRGDLRHVTRERLVVMMCPCKNMHHLTGKTVPLIVGAGGTFIDAVAEMRNLLRVDPVEADKAHSTPMFRLTKADGSRAPLTVEVIRKWAQTLADSVGQEPAHFGAHSFRIGGATALFAAGADPTVIRTMGRWSSDCYRLYVRACFEKTLDWTRICGSAAVSDVAEEFAEVDPY